jgi:hypothetical protein
MNSIDTITYTYILPEIMNENVCYDNGHYDNLMYLPQGFEVSRLACDNQSLKSVAQGFMLYDTTPVEGFYALIGQTSAYDPLSPAGFKIGVMDASFNVIYEKEYLIDIVDGYGAGGGVWVNFVYLPFDSILNLNDFIYAYFEWPDSACVGGYFGIGLYSDDKTRMNLHAFTEQRVPPVMMTDNECMACAVRYEPLFKWYGETSWTNLSSLRCDISDWYAYGFEKEDELITTLYSPPIGVSLYYTNNNGDNGGDDNGGNDEGGNNNDDNNEGGGESGLTDIDVSHLVSIYPNPADDVLKIQSSFKVKEIEIHNALGQVVLRKEGGQNIETIDVSNLQSGTYIVRIKTQRGFANKKIVIR